MDILYFAVVLFALWLIIEILSIVFKITGLDLHKARFQVISILTHTGFTTRESELIAQHPLRRKLASVLMLISYIAQASLISVLFKMVTQNVQQLVYTGIILAVFTALFLMLTRNKYISGKFNKMIERFIASRVMKQTESRPIDEVLKLSPGYAVYELLVSPESPLANTTLEKAKLNDIYVHVLKVDRGSSTIDFPQADFCIQPGDVLIIYGKIKSIKELALVK